MRPSITHGLRPDGGHGPWPVPIPIRPWCHGRAKQCQGRHASGGGSSPQSVAVAGQAIEDGQNEMLAQHAVPPQSTAASVGVGGHGGRPRPPLLFSVVGQCGSVSEQWSTVAAAASSQQPPLPRPAHGCCDLSPNWSARAWAPSLSRAVEFHSRVTEPYHESGLFLFMRCHVLARSIAHAAQRTVFITSCYCVAASALIWVRSISMAKPYVLVVYRNKPGRYDMDGSESVSRQATSFFFNLYHIPGSRSDPVKI